MGKGLKVIHVLPWIAIPREDFVLQVCNAWPV